MTVQVSWTGGLAAGGVLAAGLAVGLMGTPATAQTIKIGEVQTLSGSGSAPGIQMHRGHQLYMRLHNKDLPHGVTVELVSRDDTGPVPDVAKRLAQELVTRDHVQLLVGALYSPNAMAIAPIATEAKVPFVIVNAAGAGITRMSPYIIRVSFTLWHSSYPLGKWAAQNVGKRGYTAVSDYAPGFDAEAAFVKGFTEAGGENLGSLRFPMGGLNFVPYLQRMADAKPPVAFIFVPANEAPQMMQAVANLSLANQGIKLVSTQDLVPDEDLTHMDDTALGLITAGTYSAAAKRPQNQEFVAAWHREYGANSLPDFTSVQGWDAMAAMYDMIIATKGKFTGDQAMDFLKTWKNPNSPRGPISIDPATRDIVENVYIRRVEKVDGKLTNVEFDTIANVKDMWKELNPPK